MTFETLLRQTCTKCTESSIRTYTFNIRALAKLAGHATVPMHSRWLSTSLLEKVRKLPLGQQKKFTIAGVKALRAYDKVKKNWMNALKTASDKHRATKHTKKDCEGEGTLARGGVRCTKKTSRHFA